MRRRFTLVELLIVMTIIAAIATLALPSLVSSRQLANEARVVGYLRAISIAQEQRLSRQGDYAAQSEELVAQGLLSPPTPRSWLHGNLYYGYAFLGFAGGARRATGQQSIDGVNYLKHVDDDATAARNSPSSFWYHIAFPLLQGDAVGLSPGKAFYIDRAGAVRFSPQYLKLESGSSLDAYKRWAPGPSSQPRGR